MNFDRAMLKKIFFKYGLEFIYFIEQGSKDRGVIEWADVVTAARSMGRSVGFHEKLWKIAKKVLI
jgi:hypothetical protein